MIDSTKVQTVSTCWLCQNENVREGAHGDEPPDKWAHIRIVQRHPGFGWTNNAEHVSKHICERCLLVLLAHMNETRRTKGEADQ